jgi:hypothetical protein
MLGYLMVETDHTTPGYGYCRTFGEILINLWMQLQYYW